MRGFACAAAVTWMLAAGCGGGDDGSAGPGASTGSGGSGDASGGASDAAGSAGNPSLSVDVPDFNPGSDTISGSTWHVATDGDDAANNGSENQPWATIGRALQAVAPGDAIALHPGTYQERIGITTSGEAGKYITIMPHDGGPVTIDGTGVDLDAGNVGQWVRGLVRVADASYVRIAGLSVHTRRATRSR